MFRHSLLWHGLWLAFPSLQVIIACIMFRRRLIGEFPFFFLYTTFHAIFSPTLFILDHIDSIDAATYWQFHLVGDAIGATLRFAILYEVFRVLFLSYPALTRVSRSFFKWSTLLLVLGALLVARYSSGQSADWQLLAGIKTFDRSVAFVQCGMVILLLSFSRYFGLSWRRDVFGIALGLGIISATELAIAAIAAQMGYSEYGYVLDMASMSISLVGVSVWLVYMLKTEALARPAPSLPSSNLDSWNRELERLLQR